MTTTVYLICGVPGSGKTWVCKQLIGKFAYLAHDDYLKDFVGAVTRLARVSELPIVTECPFGEREIKAKLEAAGLYVVPIFIVEEPTVIEARYIAREGKPFPRQHATRAISIKERAIEWGAFHGTSAEVLDMLNNV